jgi:hypothetical protein
MGVIDGLLIIAVGVVLAFAGKRFIWLLVGAAGFIIAYRIIGRLIGIDSLGAFIVAVGAGLILGWLATKFAKILVAIAAFILVGYLGIVVAGWFGSDAFSLMGILFFIIGGFIGLGLMRWAGGLGLALIAALGGAALIAYGLPMLLPFTAGWLSGLIAAVVAVAGVLYQQGIIGPKTTATTAQ